MPLNQNQIETLLPEFMEYDPESVDISGVQIIDPKRMKADIEISGGPRDESEFFVDGDSDLDISFVTGNSTSDNAPTDTVVRMGIVIEKQDMYDNPNLEALPYTTLTIMLAGNLSAPEYCDDESDAYFSGTIYIEADDKAWAEEESRKECMVDIERSVEDMIRVTTGQVQMLRQLGHKGTVSRDAVGDLVRTCLKAA